MENTVLMQPRSDFEAHQRDEQAFAEIEAEPEPAPKPIDPDETQELRIDEARRYWTEDEGGD